MEAVLQVRNVSRHYGVVKALDNVSLDIGKGEFVTLLGPSGSGKTTLLRIIAGADHVTSGDLLLSGRDVTAVPSRHRGMGMVFQSYALVPHLSVFDNVAFPLSIRRRPRDEIRKRVEEALSIVRLSAYRDRRPRELSGGQQQRVAIARSLVYRPDLVLMDEPLGALDKNLREQLQFEIKNLHKELGLTVLYVTHDQEEALSMSDRVCIMRDGKIAEIGTPRELYLNPRKRFTAEFFGFANIYGATPMVDDRTAMRWGDLGTIRVDRQVDGGGEICWMVRPERVRLLAQGDSAPNELEGTIVDTTLAGPVTRFRMRLADESMFIFSGLTSAGQVPEPGMRVRVGWDRDAIIILDPS